MCLSRRDASFHIHHDLLYVVGHDVRDFFRDLPTKKMLNIQDHHYTTGVVVGHHYNTGVVVTYTT